MFYDTLNLNFLLDNAYFDLFFFCSVVRLIQQYLKESNLNKTLQTLQVNKNAIHIVKIHLNFKNHIEQFFDRIDRKRPAFH